jgi:probable F420-dependent oxidoreductase
MHTVRSPAVSASRPFRFGVQASGATSAAEWTGLARQAEDLGYATLTMADHFDDQLAIGPALGAAAAVTTSLRLGTLVYGIDYRHPVVLAKEAATLDVLSDGRFELGLGAGWLAADYEAAHIPLDRPGARIDRLVEQLEVVRRLWGDGPVDFAGEHVSVTGLEGFPKPVQRPGPPVLLGGGGPRMLRTAGRHADIVGVNFDLRAGSVGPDVGSDATAERVDEKVGWVHEGAGGRDVELHIRVFVSAVTDDRRGLAGAMAPGFGLTPEQALASPFALVGTVDEICEDLVARRERWGFSYVAVGPEVMGDLAPVVARLAGT